MQTNQPHKNAEVIKAWADGKAIQFQSMITGEWVDLGGPDDIEPDVMPWDFTLCNWRVKPEPKPDTILYSGIDIRGLYNNLTECRSDTDNLKLTFDGETGTLKAVEIIG